MREAAPHPANPGGATRRVRDAGSAGRPDAPHRGTAVGRAVPRRTRCGRHFDPIRARLDGPVCVPASWVLCVCESRDAAPQNATAGCVYDVHFTHQNSMIYS
jgi:hypothetical protein